MITNKKSFNLVNRISKTFSIVIAGFQSATTLFFRIRSKINLTFISAIAIKMSSTINLRKVKLVISQVKLRMSITQTINARRVSFIYNLKQRMKAVVTFTQLSPMIMTTKARQKISSTIKNGFLRMATDPTLATFFTLGNHDPQTLGTLDTSTLSDMDFSS